MSDDAQSFDEAKFPEVNYMLFGFKYPATFDEKVTREILTIFRDQAKSGKLFISFAELEELFANSKEGKEKEKEYKKIYNVIAWQRKAHDDFDIIKKIREENATVLNDNVKILAENDILRSVPLFHLKEDEFKETKKYFFRQLNTDLMFLALESSKKQISEYVFQKMKEFSYPDQPLAAIDRMLATLPEYQAYFNKLINNLCVEHQISKIPLLTLDQDKETYKSYLILGKTFSEQVKIFISNRLIPLLRERYPYLIDLLAETFQRHDFTINQDEITYANSRLVYHYCFLIIETKKQGVDIQVDDFNLANLIVNSWLAIENDPLINLKDYSNVELDSDFLNPIFSNYLQDPSLMENFVSAVKVFVKNLPQLIEKKELIDFFKSKGMQRKFVDDFLTVPPREIMVISSLGKTYIVSKNLITKAITMLYEGKFYKTTDTGRIQFEVLSHAFFALEKSGKDFNQLLQELQASPEDISYVKKILAKSGVYKKLQKSKDEVELSSGDQQAPVDKDIANFPSKKIYTAKDFANMEEEKAQKIISGLNLMVVEAIDSQRLIHEVFINKSELTLDDVKFLRAKPTYELIRKQFNI